MSIHILYFFALLISPCLSVLVCKQANGIDPASYSLSSDQRMITANFEGNTPSLQLKYFPNVSDSFSVSLDFKEMGPSASRTPSSDLVFDVSCDNTTDPNNSTIIISEIIKFVTKIPNNTTVTFSFTLHHSNQTVLPRFFRDEENLEIEGENFEMQVDIENWPGGDNFEIYVEMKARVSIWYIDLVNYPKTDNVKKVVLTSSSHDVRINVAEIVLINQLMYNGTENATNPTIDPSNWVSKDVIQQMIDIGANVKDYTPPTAGLTLSFAIEGNATAKYRADVSFGPPSESKIAWVLILIGVAVGIIILGILLLIVFIIYKKNPHLRMGSQKDENMNQENHGIHSRVENEEEDVHSVDIRTVELEDYSSSKQDDSKNLLNK